MIGTWSDEPTRAFITGVYSIFDLFERMDFPVAGMGKYGLASYFPPRKPVVLKFVNISNVYNRKVVNLSLTMPGDQETIGYAFVKMFVGFVKKDLPEGEQRSTTLFNPADHGWTGAAGAWGTGLLTFDFVRLQLAVSPYTKKFGVIADFCEAFLTTEILLAVATILELPFFAISATQGREGGGDVTTVASSEAHREALQLLRTLLAEEAPVDDPRLLEEYRRKVAKFVCSEEKTANLQEQSTYTFSWDGTESTGLSFVLTKVLQDAPADGTAMAFGASLRQNGLDGAKPHFLCTTELLQSKIFDLLGVRSRPAVKVPLAIKGEKLYISESPKPAQPRQNAGPSDVGDLEAQLLAFALRCGQSCVPPTESRSMPTLDEQRLVFRGIHTLKITLSRMKDMCPKLLYILRKAGTPAFETALLSPSPPSPPPPPPSSPPP